MFYLYPTIRFPGDLLRRYRRLREPIGGPAPLFNTSPRLTWTLPSICQTLRSSDLSSNSQRAKSARSLVLPRTAHVFADKHNSSSGRAHSIVHCCVQVHLHFTSLKFFVLIIQLQKPTLNLLYGVQERSRTNR